MDIKEITGRNYYATKRKCFLMRKEKINLTYIQ